MNCTKKEDVKNAKDSKSVKRRLEDKISKFYQRTKIAVAVFLSAVVLSEGIMKAEDVKFTPIPKIEVADTKTTDSKQDQSKRSFLDGDLSQDGFYIGFNYDILGKDTSSVDPFNNSKTTSIEGGEGIVAREGIIEINAKLTQGKTESKYNSSGTDRYSISNNETILKSGIVGIYISPIRNEDFRIGVGPVYENKTENYTGKWNSQERNFLYLFSDGSYWVVHSEDVNSKSTSEYEHDLLGFGGKFDANISVVGIILPIRLEAYRIKGDADIIGKSTQIEDKIFSAYDPNGQYLGDYRMITNVEVRVLDTYKIDKNQFKLSLPFASEKTLVKPYWIWTKQTENHAVYDYTLTTNRFGLDIITKVKSWKDLDLVFGGGYEYTQKNHLREYPTGNYKYNEQDQRAKITIGFQF
jgi:hypothetical protein